MIARVEIPSEERLREAVNRLYNDFRKNGLSHDQSVSATYGLLSMFLPPMEKQDRWFKPDMRLFKKWFKIMKELRDMDEPPSDSEIQDPYDFIDYIYETYANIRNINVLTFDNGDIMAEIFYWKPVKNNDKEYELKSCVIVFSFDDNAVYYYSLKRVEFINEG